LKLKADLLADFGGVFTAPTSDPDQQVGNVWATGHLVPEFNQFWVLLSFNFRVDDVMLRVYAYKWLALPAHVEPNGEY